MIEITHSIENDNLVIKIKGRLDTSNAANVEQQIDDIRQGNEDKALVLDFIELEYISSAGLRVMLKLKKSKDNMKIINVSNEVCEIFEVTGFTDIIDIEAR